MFGYIRLGLGLTKLDHVRFGYIRLGLVLARLG
jgi:hypothetical protein